MLEAVLERSPPTMMYVFDESLLAASRSCRLLYESEMLSPSEYMDRKVCRPSMLAEAISLDTKPGLEKCLATECEQLQGDPRSIPKTVIALPDVG